MSSPVDTIPVLIPIESRPVLSSIEDGFNNMLQYHRRVNFSKVELNIKQNIIKLMHTYKYINGVNPTPEFIEELYKAFCNNTNLGPKRIDVIDMFARISKYDNIPKLVNDCWTVAEGTTHPYLVSYISDKNAIQFYSPKVSISFYKPIVIVTPTHSNTIYDFKHTSFSDYCNIYDIILLLYRMTNEYMNVDDVHRISCIVWDYYHGHEAPIDMDVFGAIYDAFGCEWINLLKKLAKVPRPTIMQLCANIVCISNEMKPMGLRMNIS